MSCTILASLSHNLERNHQQKMKQTARLSKQTINVLNNKATLLCMQRCNYTKAIEYYQRALILCADLEKCHHYGGSFSANTQRKIDLCLTSSLEADNTSAPSRLAQYYSEKIEADEGFYSYTTPLPLLSASKGHTCKQAILDGLSVPEIEAVLCFNLGVCYTLLNDQDQEAFLYFDRTQDLIMRKFDISTATDGRPQNGPFLLDSITVLHNQGLLHFRSERFDEATKCYLEAMNLSVTKYGPNDISTAIALNKIGMILSNNREKGRSIDDALKCLMRSMAIRIHVLGNAVSSDRETATVFNNIGRTKFLQHDFEGALSFHMKAYNMRKQILGENHLDTSVAVFNIGNCYHYLGQSDSAFHHYSLFVKSIFNSENLELLVEDSVLAFEYIARRFQDRSSEHSSMFYKLTLESAKKMFAERKARTGSIAHILNRCGNVHFDSLQLQGALDFYKQGLEIENDIYPADDLNIATTLTNIARVHQHEGRLEEALEFYTRSKDTFQLNKNATMHKLCAEGIISALLNMGLLQEELGNYNGALEVFSETLEVQRKEYGHSDYRLSCTLNRIGTINMAMGCTQAALSSFGNSLNIRQNIDVPTDSVITVLSNIASAHLQDGNPEKALEYYKMVIDLEFAIKDETSEEFDTFGVLVIFKTMANILHEHYGKHEEAMHYIEKAISICKEDGPEDVPLGILSKYLGIAGHLKLVLGDIGGAIGFLSEIIRINRKLGCDDWTNFTTAGYDLYMISKTHHHCAAAA